MCRATACVADGELTAVLRQSLAMWGRVVEEVRSAGWRKIVIFVIAAAIAVALAYGANSTNDAANGSTLPHATLAVALSAPAVTQRR